MIAPVRDETIILLRHFDSQSQSDYRLLKHRSYEKALDVAIDIAREEAYSASTKIWEENKTISESWPSDRHNLVKQMEVSLDINILNKKERRVVAEAALSEALAGLIPGELGYLKNILMEVLNTVGKTDLQFESALSLIDNILGRTEQIST